MSSFHTILTDSIEKKDSCVCVGLDSRYDVLPACVRVPGSVSETIFAFNKEVIAATHEYAAAYKVNVAFYAGFGAEGLEGLRLTNQFLQEHFPEIPRLADSKRSEMDESVKMIRHEIFEWLGFNVVMVTPWFGFDTIRDYLEDDSKGVCIYVHDSNPSAPEIQELKLENGQFLYEYLCQLVVEKWNVNGNVFVEAGLTYPEALKRTRAIVGEEMVILTSGIGKQGGAATDLIGLLGKNNHRMLVNSSRGIILAGDPKDSREAYFKKVGNAAQKLRDEIRALPQK